jgi:1,4-alpha-glucan branching enzyme
MMETEYTEQGCQIVDGVFLAEIEALTQGRHYNPHQILGLHPYFDGKKAIRLWRPGASEVFIEVKGQVHSMRSIHDAGFFELIVDGATVWSDYKVYHHNGALEHDPYAFWPTVGELDQYLFNQGVHYELYRMLGAQVTIHQGIKGVQFAVWAPSASSVSLVGDFNHWDGRINAMRSIGSSGVWELFVPGLEEGEKYKFEVRAAHGGLKVKADPMAFYSQLRPDTASVVYNIRNYQWEDTKWVEQRQKRQEHNEPMLIYEVHLGSWKKREGAEFMNYRTLAHELVDYCKEMGFNYVELMPIAEHPFDQSWGYQVTGFYSITSRYGTPRDFQYFVDTLHKNGIGVIIDWVPGHFPTDDFALARFDGTALYEHEDSRQGFHPHWSTYIFNYGRKEVANFLIANALYWAHMMHVDGLRVDAVASMLYLDYGREDGEWIPNQYGGKENLHAIEMLKHLNAIIHQKFPGFLMIAEESTAFAGVTTPACYDGLGFDIKWNMGWMNDTLRYFSKDSIYRRYHHNDLTFGLIYAFSEKFALVLSHDEVVHGKRSLLDKMPGDLWQKFANLRLLYSYMICQPGKKLLFMGGEFGQWNEWNCNHGLDWGLLQYETHQGLKQMVAEINKMYSAHEALWEQDFTPQGFEWINFGDYHNSVIAYRRKARNGKELICIHNFTPNYHEHYGIPLAGIGTIQEVFNSDAPHYGGSGKQNGTIHANRDQDGAYVSFTLSLAPLATMIFQVV